MNRLVRIPCAFVIGVFMISATASADFVGYSVGKKDRAPLPSRLDDVDTEYLVNIEWGDYAGRKSRLGVLQVDNTSTTTSFTVSATGGDIDYSSSASGVPVNGIESIVIDSLARTNRFRLVERTVLGDVLGEQDLAASGRVAAPSGAATGSVLGAEYLVQVVVTDYESKTSSSDKGIGGLLAGKVPVLGGVKMGKGTGRVGLNFRLIDAVTSEIVFTKQIESVINESDLSLGGIGFSGDVALGGFISNYSRTP
ncbi:MAG: CsgG/HfaB family protein, partial [Gammaproteobacteria bacterium]|nr:CsgG/HfaB family protein [Gammaproteobacteria bacterium]